MDELKKCPDCGGAGGFESGGEVCCGGSQWECGASGCTGPIDGRYLEECPTCEGSGQVLESRDLVTVTDEMVEAWADVIAERRRQTNVEDWSYAHDDKYEREELARAAACYAFGEQLVDEANRRVWPWSDDWWKPSFPIDRRRDLVKAGALILAEIERIDRAALKAALGGDHG